MSRRKKVASVAFTGVAALGAVGLTAGHAHAATATVTNVTVTPGGPYSASNVGSPVLVDTTTNAQLTCTTAFASGSLTGSPTGSKVGTVSSATFTNCTVATLPFTAHLKKPAMLYATGATSAGGVTQGELKSISASITGTGGFACHAVVTGSLPGSFHNASDHLVIDPNHSATLHVESATSCAGELNTSNMAYFAATYNVIPPQTVSATT
jgi:hypothetical protein